jgi:hypothetical protein
VELPGSLTATPSVAAERRARLPLALLLSVGLTLVVLLFVYPNLWYGLHDISDVPLYHSYAERIAFGDVPFSPGFDIEYPPLAVPLFRLPGYTPDVNEYMLRFGVWMGAFTALTAALTALLAVRLWPYGRRAYVAAVLFPVGAALIGPIIINRYDVAVALVVAGLLLCLVRRWYTAAAFILGIGFALKFTPAAILPLVLILAGRPRRWVWPIIAFTGAALAPFVQPLLTSPSGIGHVFAYHLERPLQIESVLGTPMLFGQLLGADWAWFGYSHGSHFLDAPGVGVAAAISGPLTLAAVAAVYVLIWRRRTYLLEAPQAQVLAVLGLLLALMTFSKVLSPQYMIWLLPAWAIMGAADRALAIVGGLVLLLTQAEFPAMYMRLLHMQPDTVAIVVVRNTLLLVFFVLAAQRLYRLPVTTRAIPKGAGAPRQEAEALRS